MTNKLIKIENIQSRIYTLRDKQVMLDRDLAELYCVENKRLNEQVRRNIERFPDEFRFQLIDDEKNKLVANCDRFETLKHSSLKDLGKKWFAFSKLDMNAMDIIEKL